MGKPLTTLPKPSPPSPRDERLAAIGLVNPDAATTPEGMRQAALPDLLVRALARGDEHPIEGTVASVADEMEAVGAVASEEDKALGTLLSGWSARLRVAVEMGRRYREAPASGPNR